MYVSHILIYIFYSADGYISIKDILQHKSFKEKYNFTDIKRVVDNDCKKRYKLRFDDKQNVYEIKANQGHSIKEVHDTELTPILEVCINNFKMAIVIFFNYYKYGRIY